MTTVYDAHAHAGDLAEHEIRQRQGILTLLSCGNPAQAREAESLCADFPVFSMTAGVHPWYAAKTRLSEMTPYMERAILIGEIGLDSVWCDTPMQAQRSAFDAQLNWAAAHGKGIVLHTKGCEAEIAEAIAGFPYPVIVHWYSGGQGALERFLAQGCYFTIGPDVSVNSSVQAVAALVPDNRILFETDGMDAVRWALGSGNVQQPGDALFSSVQFAAQLRRQSSETLIQYANGNFCRLSGR